jgi:uncharacterized protein (DUF2062 family)
VNAPSQGQPPGFFRRRIGEPIRHQLTQGVTPEKIALTVALASGLSVFPVLGTTTVLCFFAGIFLKLNQPIVQGVNILASLAFIPLAVVFIKLGDVLTHSTFSSLDIHSMARMAVHHPADFIRRFGATTLHGILGWFVVMAAWLPLAYCSALPLLRRLKPHLP